MKSIIQVMNPIEFREIYHPQKNAAQGILEMFTEILTIQDAAKIPMSKIENVHKETYEIRIIIWETRDIPLVDGGSVDIFLKCTFDPTGWSEDEVTKETDTHMSSKDGYGQFNWRMKFDLTVPCEFPRLKFKVLDAGLAADEAIGETTLSLKSTIKKLRKEEKINIPKSYLTFFDPTSPEEEKGILMFSLDILTKADAN
jgi:predicted small metal-binding protein